MAGSPRCESDVRERIACAKSALSKCFSKSNLSAAATWFKETRRSKRFASS